MGALSDALTASAHTAMQSQFENTSVPQRLRAHIWTPCERCKRYSQTTRKGVRKGARITPPHVTACRPLHPGSKSTYPRMQSPSLAYTTLETVSAQAPTVQKVIHPFPQRDIIVHPAPHANCHATLFTPRIDHIHASRHKIAYITRHNLRI